MPIPVVIYLQTVIIKLQQLRNLAKVIGFKYC